MVGESSVSHILDKILRSSHQKCSIQKKMFLKILKFSESSYSQTLVNAKLWIVSGSNVTVVFIMKRAIFEFANFVLFFLL